MKKTKIFFLLLTLCFSFATMAIAQSSAVKKAANTTFTLTTFDTKGSILSTTNGVFVSTDGVCVVRGSLLQELQKLLLSTTMDRNTM